MPRAAKPYWEHDDRYPKEGPFGRLLDWHLVYWHTHADCSQTERNPIKIKLFAFANNVYDRIPVDGNESPEKSLRNWRNGKNLPDDEDIVERICFLLFGKSTHLDRWKSDLKEAFSSQKDEKTLPGSESISSTRQSIPPPVAYFMGRNDEVEDLAKMLASPEGPSAILVQGGPGIGKTELTKAIAHHPDIAARFGGRRYFVSLETATTAAAMQDAIIRAIDSDPKKGFAVALQGLHGRDTLLVLDNLETPWEPHDQQQATEQTLAHLAAVSGLALLASFRGYEAVDGPLWHRHPVDALPPEIAADLFLSIAGKEVEADPDLGNFITALGGIPLAIALVARRAHGFTSLAPIWKEWLRIGSELAKHPRRDAGRLTSLYYSIELSMASCEGDVPALRLFSLLGCLPAGIADEDLETLLRNDAFEARERLRKLGLSVEQAGRTYLLPPVRDHALRNYADRYLSDIDWTTHYLNLSDTIYLETEGADQSNFHNSWNAMAASFSRFYLQKEMHNIEAAFSRKVLDGNLHETQHHVLNFFRLCRSFRLGTPVFAELAQACAAVGESLAEAGCWTFARSLAFDRGEYEDARRLNDRSLTTYTASGDHLAIAECLLMKGAINKEIGEFGIAKAAFNDAIQCFGSIQNWQGESMATLHLADLEYDCGNTDAAHTLYSFFVEIQGQRGESNTGFARAWQRIGLVEKERGNRVQSIAAFTKAKDIYHSLDFPVDKRHCENQIYELSQHS